MVKELRGQTALVTGGGRGFGRSIALRLATEGASVTVASRTLKELKRTVSEIEAAGGKAFAVEGDVANPGDVARIVRGATERFGPITLLVSNAGIPGPFSPIWLADPDQWWHAQQVHIRAPFMFIREILPSMIERRRGCILVVSAIGSYRVDHAMSAYCLGKNAQNRLVQLTAAEVGEFGVGVFAVDPGFVATEMAEITMRDPGAHRWRPEMIRILKEGKSDPDSWRDLDRCAERCVDLASGRYDALSGSYLGLHDSLEELLRLKSET